MGEVLDRNAWKQAKTLKEAIGLFGMVLWSSFFTDKDGKQRVAFETLLLEDFLPPRVLRDLAVSLANYKEQRRAGLFLPASQVLESPKGILHLRGVTEPMAEFREEPVTFAVLAHDQYLVHCLPWQALTEKAKSAEAALRLVPNLPD